MAEGGRRVQPAAAAGAVCSRRPERVGSRAGGASERAARFAAFEDPVRGRPHRAAAAGPVGSLPHQREPAGGKLRARVAGTARPQGSGARARPYRRAGGRGRSAGYGGGGGGPGAPRPPPGGGGGGGGGGDSG